MFGFDTGLSALSAARLAIETVGNNLANAATPGYSRARVLTETGTPTLVGRFYEGGGVRVASLDRVTDDLLLTRYREQSQEVERRNVVLENLLGVESAFGEPGSAGLSSQLGYLFNSFSSLSTAPEDIALRKDVLIGADGVGERFRRVRDEIGSTQSSVRGLINLATTEVNTITSALASLNEELAQSQGFGQNAPHALLDKQGQLLDELSTYVDFTIHDVGAGRVNVQVGGQMVVSYGETTAMSARVNADDEVEIRLEGSNHPVEVSSGRLMGLLELDEQGVGERIRDLDELAKNLILEVNRIHSTGVPAGGGFTVLRSTNDVSDVGNLLNDVGLPFEISDGSLQVSVVDDVTGEVTQSRVDIDTASDSVAGLVAKLDAINGLTASIDGNGRLNLSAAPGKRFHFGAVLPSDGNGAGTLGGDSATLSSLGSGPFNLSNGASFDVSVDGGAPQTITFGAGQFQDITRATPEEVATAINATLTGAQAEVVGGRLVLKSQSTGTSSQLALTDGTGSPLAALGVSTGPATGAASGVDVTMSGAFEGANDRRVYFQPTGDGTIGVTPGLQIQAVDETGQVLAVFDVGSGYSPGDELEVVDGIKVAFGAGDISASNGDFTFVDAVADGDASDVLAAFGLNSLFTGSSAEDIDVRQDLYDDSSLLSTGLGPAASDNRNVLRLLGLRDGSVSGLGDNSIEEFYGGIVSDVGQSVSRAELNYETETLLRDSFESRLESVRGVSVDEELASLQRYEQAYQAAARYISTINEVSQILFSI